MLLVLKLLSLFARFPYFHRESVSHISIQALSFIHDFLIMVVFHLIIYMVFIINSSYNSSIIYFILFVWDKVDVNDLYIN